MGPVHHRALDRSTRASFLKRDKQGVASTVGTIMALMIFIAFMALITNSYVPAWMLDNERSHMNEVIEQFGQLKGNVDSMILHHGVTGDNSIKMYAPIKLGSEGVPLFATATVGLLSYVPQGASVSKVSVAFTDEKTGTPISIDSGGRVDLYVPNRYYVEQWVCYENGAIIVRQNDGQSVKAMPNLDIEKNPTNGKISVAFTQIRLTGSNQSVTGSDSVGFNLDLRYVDPQTYKWADGGGTLNLTITTNYGAAWHKYLQDYLASKNLVNGQDYILSPEASPSISTDGVTTITLTLYHVSELNHKLATMSMTLLTT